MFRPLGMVLLLETARGRTMALSRTPVPPDGTETESGRLPIGRFHSRTGVFDPQFLPLRSRLRVSTERALGMPSGQPVHNALFPRQKAGGKAEYLVFHRVSLGAFPVLFP